MVEAYEDYYAVGKKVWLKSAFEFLTFTPRPVWLPFKISIRIPNFYPETRLITL